MAYTFDTQEQETVLTIILVDGSPPRIVSVVKRAIIHLKLIREYLYRREYKLIRALISSGANNPFSQRTSSYCRSSPSVRATVVRYFPGVSGSTHPASDSAHPTKINTNIHDETLGVFILKRNMTIVAF